MRGLPSSGKSHLARRLAGAGGIICETDQYFHTHVGADPFHYDFQQELLPQARQWSFARFCDAVDRGVSPVIVDRCNSLSPESRRYVLYALQHGYRVELREPDSPWWQVIRTLLADKQGNRDLLYAWADRLAEMNRATHRTPASVIRLWIDKWRCDLTVDEIAGLRPARSASA